MNWTSVINGKTVDIVVVDDDNDEMDDVHDILQSRYCGVDGCFNFPKSSHMHAHTAKHITIHTHM